MASPPEISQIAATFTVFLTTMFFDKDDFRNFLPSSIPKAGGTSAKLIDCNTAVLGPFKLTRAYSEGATAGAYTDNCFHIRRTVASNKMLILALSEIVDQLGYFRGTKNNTRRTLTGPMLSERAPRRSMGSC